MNKPYSRISRTLFSSPSSFPLKTRALLPAIVCLASCFSARPSFAQSEQAREGQASARPAAAAAAAGGRISGRVVSEDGKPMSNTVVTVYKVYARVQGPPATLATDAEGRFQSGELSPGIYSVSATSPGYATALPDVNERGEANFYRPGETVNITMVKGGVITGTVRDASGEPVVGVPVRAVRLREAGAPMRFTALTRDRTTDDRGVYRLYGLAPGTYLVSAGGSSRILVGFNAYDGDVAVYFPSSTRDTAVEVGVRAGEEASNIDIRYRSERGRSISGQILGANQTEARRGITVILRQSINAGYTDQIFIPPLSKAVFSFEGLGDGEYELVAQQGGGTQDELIASVPRRVSVKGGNVTGVELTLAPLASVAGRAVLEPAPKEPCNEAGAAAAALTETIITIRRDGKGESRDSQTYSFFSSNGTLPDEQGDFVIRGLAGGSYRLNLRLPDDFWYTRSIALPGAATTAQAATPPRPRAAPPKGAQAQGSGSAVSARAPSYLIPLRAGERSTGMTIRVAQDGAIVRGKVSPSTEGMSLPENLRVYLIPQEHERAEDILRFSEANVKGDGTFLVRNLAPGRYLFLTRPATENESADAAPRPAFWDADSRAKLRREAEAANAALELKPCQRVGDYELRYPAVK